MAQKMHIFDFSVDKLEAVKSSCTWRNMKDLKKFFRDFLQTFAIKRFRVGTF